ncbi:hypothetical protein Thiowin_00650 [Thiorhodovibrio winogradskyi]|uniref:Uncharacterized protein n=1 Tax=Thiorhodovibrio winogradskyi TaxID=77007 RepID=A0ABZ0S659_9GAMM
MGGSLGLRETLEQLLAGRAQWIDEDPDALSVGLLVAEVDGAQIRWIKPEPIQIDPAGQCLRLADGCQLLAMPQVSGIAGEGIAPVGADKGDPVLQLQHLHTAAG